VGKLSNKQRAFIEEYLTCWDATKSARNAGYSEKTARSIGCENLTKPYIKAAIEQRIAEKAMTADEVLLRLAEHGRGDIGEMMTEAGTLDLVTAKASGKTRLIKAVTESDKGLRIEMYDAQAALVQLGRAHGLFTDKLESTVKAEVDGSDRLLSAVERLDALAAVHKQILLDAGGSDNAGGD
jgi:phage terminase small subunit